MDARVYRFGDIEVHPQAHRVLRGDAEIALEPKAFAVLEALLESPGKAFGRDELLDRVWGHRHVTPGVLNRVVALLRKALGDDAENPRYIQTLHSLGYRFIADVQQLAPPAAPPEPLPAPAVVTEEPPPAMPVASPLAATHPRRGLAISIAVATAALAVLVASGTWWSRHRDRPLPSIAVLPFVNIGGNPDDAYFAEGLTEEMRNALAGVHGLKVAASVSPAARQGAIDARALGQSLGVATVLEANVRRQGARIRVGARLSDTADGFALWSQTYDREIIDVFDTQRAIANEVVQSLLGVQPGERAALDRRLTPTHDIAAFDDYLRGMHLLREANAAAPDAAIGLFNQALRKDSAFARAQAGICSAEISRFENLHSVDAYDNARIACQRALAMDPMLADTSLALAELYRSQGDLDPAIAQYRKIAHEPAVRTRVELGLARVYAARHERAQADAHFRQALEYDPDDPYVHSAIGYQQYLDGDPEAAVASLRKAVRLKDDDAGLWVMFGALCMETGANTEARQALERSIAIAPSYAALTNLGLLRYQDGDYAAAAALQRRAIELDPNDFMVWANLGMALKTDTANAVDARAAYAQAASRAQRYVEAQPGDARATAALGLYRMELGDAAQARELVARAEALGTQTGEVALLDAETLAGLGDLDAARTRLATARANGIDETLIASNAMFKRLGLLASEKAPGTAGHP